MRATSIAAALACALVLWGQSAILQIRVVEGEGAVHAPGSRSARPIIVEVTDETGRPAAGASLSFHLPEDGPSGTFTNGLRTEVLTADSNGRAVLRGLQLNRQGGRFAIRIIASKEQARAGTVSFQYIADPKGGAAASAQPASGRQTPVAASGGGKSRKWWIVAAAAGAAAAGGIASRGGSGAPASPPPVVVPPPPALVIGPPSITVTRP